MDGNLPAGAFDPNPADPEMVATNLVKAGAFISSSAVLGALRPLPSVVMSHIHIQYAFGVALAVIFLFGLAMIGVGWLVADYPTIYTAFGRAMTRASHVVLVFAMALHVLLIPLPST